MEPVCGNTDVLFVPQQSCEGIFPCHCLAQSSTPLASVAVPGFPSQVLRYKTYQTPTSMSVVVYVLQMMESEI